MFEFVGLFNTVPPFLNNFLRMTIILEDDYEISGINEMLTESA